MEPKIITNNIKEQQVQPQTTPTMTSTTPINNKSVMFRTHEDMLELSKQLSADVIRPRLDTRYVDYYVNPTPNITRISRDTITRRW